MVLAVSLRHANADDAPIDHYILALSWQPAFCQYHPDLPECRAEASQANKGQHRLSLHGLWPNDETDRGLSYCGVSATMRAEDDRREWCRLPALEISKTETQEILAIMPGAESRLDRHEWLKHGTCSGLSQEDYLRLASKFADDVGHSEIGRMIEAAAGGVAEKRKLRAAFESSFGPGTMRALSLRCRKDGGRSYLSEIWIWLLPSVRLADPETATLENSLLDLRRGAKDRSCPALVYIDAPGL